ncbi:MAG TPA: HIT domain-containing protein [Candidatus Saccharimonadales bacterium]|nr:HIT domain-containing protein [Candidatus Saccharimonadales bacterium]
MSENFTNLDNARHDDQRQVMEAINSEGHCPFCSQNLARYHKQPIIRQGEHWLLTPNQWPYEHTREHLLAITAYHTEALKDLRPGSFEELQQHMQWAEQAFNIASGGLAMRFGKVESNGATVRHLHMHLIVPDEARPDDAKVRFKIS